MEENLIKLIELAKQSNNPELVQKLTEALELAKQSQNTQEDIKLKSQESINQDENKTIEEKQEVVIENKKEEEDKKVEEEKVENPIKKQGHGEVSTITVYQNGKVSLETKYLDIPIQGNNIELNSAMRRIGINLGIDDVTNDHSSEEELLDVLEKLENEEDIEKIENFLEEAAKVGQKGKELEEKYYAETLERRELPYDTEYQELLKAISFVEAEDNEKGTKKYADGSYEDLIIAYQQLIAKIEALIGEANNKMSRERMAMLETKVMFIKERIRIIKENAEKVKETSFILD